MSEQPAPAPASVPPSPTVPPAAEVAARYRRLGDAFAATIAAVPAARWADLSPCEGWSARDVVRHVVDSQRLFLGLVGRPLPDDAAPGVDDDPAGAWDAVRAVVLADLGDPERAEAAFDGMFGRTTFVAAVHRFLCADLVIHRWDLARATGGDERIDPAEVAQGLRDWPAFGDGLRGPGGCGPALDAGPDADDQARLLAFLGRA